MIAAYPALGIRLERFRPTILCHDCQDIVDEAYTYPLADGMELTLCENCFFFRVKVEGRILDLVDSEGSTRQTVLAGMEDLGIDSKRSFEALQRLLKCRRLREGDPR